METVDESERERSTNAMVDSIASDSSEIRTSSKKRTLGTRKEPEEEFFSMTLVA